MRRPFHPITSGLVLRTWLIPVILALLTWLGCASGPGHTVPNGRKSLSSATPGGGR